MVVTFKLLICAGGYPKKRDMTREQLRFALKEIKRSQRVSERPNFLFLLGDRYGWRPLPYEIPADEFECLLPFISKDDTNTLSYWYRKDDNAVPPVYWLQARKDEYKEDQNWELIEKQIWLVLQNAALQTNLSSDELIKYQASATEQEIIAGVFQMPDAHEHVFGFFRHIQNLPSHKRAQNFFDCDETGQPDREAAERLQNLKNWTKAHLGENILEYKTVWAGEGIKLDYLKQLCEDAYRNLEKIILDEIAQLEEINPIKLETETHRLFGQDRARNFTGRENDLETIAAYLDADSNEPFLVWGKSGIGKSALMAKAIQQTIIRKPKAKLTYRFVGASPESTNYVNLLQSICREIYISFNLEEEKRNRLTKIQEESIEENQKRKKISDLLEEYTIPQNANQLTDWFIAVF